MDVLDWQGVVAVGLAVILPLLFLAYVYQQDSYAIEDVSAMVVCFVWGFVALGGAYLINNALVDHGLIAGQLQRVVGAPIVEELLKAVPLFYFLWRGRITYVVDGAIYGFAAGTAYAIGENLFYLNMLGLDPELALERALSTSLLHGSATAMVGLALGKLRFQRHGSHSRSVPFVVTLVAMPLRGAMVGALALRAGLMRHAGFNLMVGHPTTLLVLLAIVVGVASLLLTMWFISRGLRDERRWIQEQLARVGTSADEIRLIDDLPELHHNLSSIAQRFGDHKRETLEKMLRLEARVGLRRKVLEFSEDGERARVAADVRSLEEQVASLRREVGTSCLAYFHKLSWHVLKH